MYNRRGVGMFGKIKFIAENTAHVESIAFADETADTEIYTL